MVKQIYPFKVSVCIITYNQAGYIKKAVDSAIAQEVDFAYEIIIGDDYSTDGTREILLEYKRQYPHLIKLNLQEQHDEEGIAGRRNNMSNIRSAQGKYIAFLDGDDFWISKDKLQKQANFMDAHPEFAICCTDVLDIYEEKNKRRFRSEVVNTMQTSRKFKYRTIIKRKLPIVNSSAFYRKKYITPLPHWFTEVYLADFCLHLLALSKGPGKYFKDLKVGKVWMKNSIVSQYYSGRRWIEIKKHDYAIIAENFKGQQALPYSYKSLFYMKRAYRFKNQKQFFRMVLATYKVYKYDATYLVHWLETAKMKTTSRYKKNMLTFVINGLRLTFHKSNS